ncbi:TetR/AcrR family transcriptional regulator [Streptomyces sp. NPDC059753]|uniref:TetR/AcrR family transcriptional regulator n=1 Tax=Streptomyces sp. NPDC059753 TaxID=3346933 RepID=UPI003664154C
MRADVLAAAAGVLMAEGVGGFTVEKVIAASGVSSATIYKHWPSRGALALDGYLHAVGDAIAVRDSGDIRADLEHMVVAFVRMVSRRPEGAVFAQLIGAAQTDQELAAQFDHHYFGPRRREAFALLEATKERGQIDADTDIGVLVDLIWGACYIRLLLPHLTDQLTPAFAREVVAQALSGVLVDTATP